MEFLIADTFTDSLAELTNQEQKAVKTTSFDLQMDPSRPGMQFHRISASKDDHFWSVRVNRDLRLVVHKTSQSFLLCYVDHHDEAYAWAERRKIERHPKTGAAQIVQIREKVVEIPTYVARPQEEATASKKLLFEEFSEDELLSYGVPKEWLRDVKGATEETVFEVVERLPQEAGEALLELATGGKPEVPTPSAESPFRHPDAQRRFRMIENRDELERALEFPWEKWSVFLHPAQRSVVEGDYNGPARVAGSAGTGKTIVAIHRAVHLAENKPDTRVLLTTFSDPLARSLKNKLRTLISNRPRLAERIDIHALDAAALRLHRFMDGVPTVASPEQIREMITRVATANNDHAFTTAFIVSEWEKVVDAWQLDSWEAYRDIPRAGRRTRLPQSHRKVLWEIFEEVRAALEEEGLLTMSQVYSGLTGHYRNNPSPYHFVLVDEAQDVSVAQLRFLGALTGDQPDGLFFAGDLGQRIFQPPFSWKRLGVDIRGRSFTLRINYRTSHQIRQHADRLLASEIADMDGVVESREGTQSVFNGPPPTAHLLKDREEEVDKAAAWLSSLVAGDLEPEEIGVFIRSEREINHARQAVKAAGLPYTVLDERLEAEDGKVAICTMHLAKGLEYRAVAVLACDDEVIPHQERIENIGDEADLLEVYETERHLLYVACTRARDHLFISAVAPGSEFLEDMRLGTR